MRYASFFFIPNIIQFGRITSDVITGMSGTDFTTVGHIAIVKFPSLVGCAIRLIPYDIGPFFREFGGERGGEVYVCDLFGYVPIFS